MFENTKKGCFACRQLRTYGFHRLSYEVPRIMVRFFKRRALLFIVIQLLLPLFLFGQQVHYSPLPGYNARSTSFEVIGEYNGLRLIYTESYGDRRITFFDNTMKPVDTIMLTDLPFEAKEIHFIDLSSRFIMLYQYEHRRDIICKAVLYDGDGKRYKHPVVVDRITHPLQVVGNVAYSHVVSEDKSRILIYKTTHRQEADLLTLTTFLMDSSLRLLYRGKVTLPRRAADPGPAQIKLSGKGGLYLVYGKQDVAYQSYFQQLTVLYKPAMGNTLVVKSIFIKDHLPGDHVLLTIDERQQKLWLNTFNFDDKQRHFISLSTWQLDMDSLDVLQHATQEFKASTRKSFAEKRSRRRAVFDDYVPSRLIFSRAGTALLVAEKQFTDGEGHTQYGDIGFFKLNEKGELTLIRRIARTPDQYTRPFQGSFLMVNRGKALHILLNRSHSVTRFLSSRIYLLRDYRYLGNNKLQVMPVMEKLDKGYQWLPSLGKQVTGDEVVVPCLARGNLLFGSITY